MREEIRSIRGIDICVESFGSPYDPCVLLIMGAMASMLWWDERFCEALAERGLFVVRFDNRDVGRSSCEPPGGAPTYDVDDMVLDALGVLDSYGVARAHFVGMSLGGMIAQIAALRFPERVASVTPIASGVWDDRPDLPAMDESIAAYHMGASSVDWQDERSVVDYLVGGWRRLGGSKHAFDEAQARRLAQLEFRRASSLLSMFNHASLGGAEDLYGAASRITVPVLIIHGTEDPVLPLPHAIALAEAAPDAVLIRLEGRGHEIHPRDWPIVLDHIERHVRR